MSPEEESTEKFANHIWRMVSQGVARQKNRVKSRRQERSRVLRQVHSLLVLHVERLHARTFCESYTLRQSSSNFTSCHNSALCYPRPLSLFTQSVLQSVHL